MVEDYLQLCSFRFRYILLGYQTAQSYRHLNLL